MKQLILILILLIASFSYADMAFTSSNYNSLVSKNLCNGLTQYCYEIQIKGSDTTPNLEVKYTDTFPDASKIKTELLKYETCTKERGIWQQKLVCQNYTDDKNPENKTITTNCIDEGNYITESYEATCLNPINKLSTTTKSKTEKEDLFSKVAITTDKYQKYMLKFNTPVSQLSNGYGNSGKWSIYLDGEEIIDPTYSSICTLSRSVTIPANTVNETLINFPFLVFWNSTSGANTNYFNFSHMNSTGWGQYFVTSDNATALNFERESWNRTSNNTAYVWVASNVTYNTATVAWNYYNCTTDGENKTAVWDNDYRFVQHLSQPSTQFNDSTINGYNSTAMVLDAMSQIGVADGAANFTIATTQYVKFGDVLNQVNNTYVTLEAWTYPINRVHYGQDVLAKGDNFAFGIYDPTGQPAFKFVSGGAQSYFANVGNVYYNNTWNYHAFSMRWGNGSTVKMYMNGTLKTGYWAYGSGNVSPAVSVKNLEIHALAADGSLGYDDMAARHDEVRISNVTRNDSWINATFMTITSPMTFVIFGAPATPTTPQPPVTNTSTITPSPVALGTDVLLMWCNSTDTDTATITYNWNIYINGVLFETDSKAVTQGVNYNVRNITGLGYGSNVILDCWANDSSANSTHLNSSATYIAGFVINSEQYLNATETQTIPFNISLNISSATPIGAVNLTYNNTQYPATKIINSSSNANYSVNVTMPLISSNYTNLTFSWNVYFTSGGSGYINITPTRNNSIVWGYYIYNTTVITTNVIEGDPFTYNATLTNYGVATLQVNYTWNGNTGPMTAINSTLYSYAIAAPEVTPDTNLDDSLPATALAYISYDGLSFQRTYATTSTMNVTNLFLSSNTTNITHCPYGAVALNFTFYDQDTLIAIQVDNFQITTTTRNIINNSFTRNQTFSTTSTNYSSNLCIYPSLQFANTSTTYYASATDYTPAIGSTGYLTIASIMPLLTTYPIYLGNSTTAKPTQLKVLQAPTLPLEGVNITIERYIAPATYIPITSCTTDVTGSCLVYLTPNLYYYFYNVTYTSLTQFGPEVLSCSPISSICYRTFTLGTSGQIDYYANNIRGNCSWVNTTRTLTCSSNDATGTITQGNLTVWRVLANMSNTQMCSSVYAGSTGTLTCILPAVPADYYYIFRGVDAGNNNYYFENDWIREMTNYAQDFGSTGLIIGAIFLIAVAALGTYSLTIAIILMDFGIIALQLMGIINVGWAIVTGFIIISGMLIYKLRT